MAILLNNHGYENQPWQTELSHLLPDMPVHLWPDVPEKDSIRYALVWNHPEADLLQYPRLQAVFSLGAGMEHLQGVAQQRPDLPLVPLADPAVAQDMVNHAIYWVVHYQRHYQQYQQQQTDAMWKRHAIIPTDQFTIGVSGMGRIGSLVATTLKQLGYPVSGWSNTQANLKSIQHFQGGHALPEFLRPLRVLINCLPLTASTHHLIDADFLSLLSPEAVLINISRGAVIDDQALLNHLNQGKLKGAALDAFAIEPLPDDHAYWQHPLVHVTPHMAGATYARTAAKVVADNIYRMEQGEMPFPLYDFQRGF